MSADITGGTPDWRDMRKCDLEGHVLAQWHKRVYDNGSTHIEFFCERCERPVTREKYGVKGHSVTPEWFREHIKADPDGLPLRRRSLRIHICYLCGRDDSQCEYHHVAPQSIYGKDAERYPVVPLCKTCHDDETKQFTERLERYVQERIRRYLARRGDVA